MLPRIGTPEGQKGFLYQFVITGTRNGRFSGENADFYRTLFPDMDRRGKVPLGFLLPKRLNVRQNFLLAVCEEETKPDNQLLKRIRHCFEQPSVPKSGRILVHFDANSIDRPMLVKILRLLEELNEPYRSLGIYFYLDQEVDIGSLGICEI
ncbi:MAG: hypothetical protein ABIH38_01505 [Patescibacteria group bacterium]